MKKLLLAAIAFSVITTSAHAHVRGGEARSTEITVLGNKYEISPEDLGMAMSLSAELKGRISKMNEQDLASVRSVFGYMSMQMDLLSQLTAMGYEENDQTKLIPTAAYLYAIGYTDLQKGMDKLISTMKQMSNLGS